MFRALMVNTLPGGKIPAFSKLKASADNKLNVTKNFNIFLHVEKIL